MGMNISRFSPLAPKRQKKKHFFHASASKLDFQKDCIKTDDDETKGFSKTHSIFFKRVHL